MAKYNDLDMSNWREYDDIETDSLWIIEKRNNSGAHSGHYHGNFVPQIPYQLFSRYTKKGDWILDPFMGSGTSLIEAQRMNRNSIGIELQKDVAKEAYNRIITEKNDKVSTNIIVSDSKSCNIKRIMYSLGIEKVQFVIMHPPYWNIIKFSDNPDDLSNCSTLDLFLESFAEVIDNVASILEKNRYCTLVIGDKYANKQIVPLSFHCMNLMLERGFILKATIVKNFNETKGKSNKSGIWRYRALSSDFYIFKHEYIFIFKK